MFILICRSISCNDHALIARLMAKQFLTRMFSAALTRSLRGRPRTRPWQLILRQLQTAKLWRRCLLCKTTHCDHVGSRVYYIYIWFIYIYTVYGILYGIHIYVYMLFSCSELSISIDQYMLQPWLDQNHLLQVHAIDASEVGKDPGASSWFEGQLCPVWVQWAEPWIAHISHLNDYVMTDIFFGCV